MTDFNFSLDISAVSESKYDPQAMLDALLQEYNDAPGIHREWVDKKRAEIEELYRKISERNNKFEEEQRLRRDKIAHLKAEIARLAAAKKYERTAKIVKEIVADFPAWQSAREYQVEGVISIVHAFLSGEKGFLNADDMGMGKTLETIFALYIISKLLEREYGRQARILWLTKSTILETNSTKNEIGRWWPDLKIVQLSGSKPVSEREFMVELAHDTGCMLLTNYEAVRTTKNLQKKTFDLIVMDEVHKLKGGANAQGPTAVWESVKSITPKSRFLQILSGTPIVNRPEEVWSYLHIFDPITFDDAKKFNREFAHARAAGFEIDTDKLLKVALKGRMIRRKPEEVGHQMPDYTEIEEVVFMTPRQQEAYDQMKKNFFIWLEEQETAVSSMAIIAQLTRLRQINIWPVIDFKTPDPETGEEIVTRLNIPESGKIDRTMELIEEAQDQVLIGSNFNEPLEEIVRRCRAAGMTAAAITGAHRQDMGDYERQFQQGELQVLCMNLQMGEGLNLQKDKSKWPGGTSFGITLDRWWNTARNEQFERRFSGARQTVPAVIYNLYSARSVDYFIQAKIEAKDGVIGSIMNSKEIRPASEWKAFLKDLM